MTKPSLLARKSQLSVSFVTWKIREEVWSNYQRTFFYIISTKCFYSVEINLILILCVNNTRYRESMVKVKNICLWNKTNPNELNCGCSISLFSPSSDCLRKNIEEFSEFFEFHAGGKMPSNYVTSLDLCGERNNVFQNLERSFKSKERDSRFLCHLTHRHQSRNSKRFITTLNVNFP